MTEKKGWAHTVLGWIVVQDDAEQQSAGSSGPSIHGSIVDAADARAGVVPVATATAPAAAPAAPGPKIFRKEPPPSPGGHVDFARVFEAAEIDSQEQERVTKSIELLRSLPTDTPPPVKKQIVEASLKAFGVPIDKIIETGVEEIQALEAYIRDGAAATQKAMDEADQRVRTLEESIAQLRAEMQQRVADQQSILKTCNDKKLEVQQILEFFGQAAVAKVVKDSPKLFEPS